MFTPKLYIPVHGRMSDSETNGTVATAILNGVGYRELR